MNQPYWIRHPDGPFVTLIAVAATYLEPENYDLESLRRLAKRPGDQEMSVLKEELREAIRDPGRLPGDELFRHVEYDDGSDEAFLRRLWQDLYGDEPVTAPGAGSGARTASAPPRGTGGCPTRSPCSPAGHNDSQPAAGAGAPPGAVPATSTVSKPGRAKRRLCPCQQPCRVDYP